MVDAALGKNAKFRDLAKRLAGIPNASWAILKLWSFTAANRPDGDLTGIDPAEIMLTQVEWDSLLAARGPRSEYGFIEAVDGVVVLHDWERSGKHQTAAERRRHAARIAGLASARQRLEQVEHALFQAEELDETRVEIQPTEPRVTKSAGRALEDFLDEGFAWFYELYPRHECRKEARKAWGKLHRLLLTSDGGYGITKALKVRMAEHVMGKLRDGEWENDAERRRYIPLPATYLNQRKWEE